MPEWTSEQKKAIESRDGTILVSAAAGSGKTAVLVERVIRRLSDENKPCPADRLLIVTFTRSATHEMRERIYHALSEKSAENPGSVYLRRQLSLLPFAKISTIDSFCGELVRDNFHDLNISPDCKLIEGAELKIMENDALEKTLNELYSEKDASFTALADLLVNGADDSALGELIKELYRNSTAFALPEKWLDSLLEEYYFDGRLSESRWGRLILNEAGQAVEYYRNIVDKMLAAAAQDDVVFEKYGPCVRGISEVLNGLKASICEKSWDEICRDFASAKLPNLGRLPKGYTSEIADYIKEKKKLISDAIGTISKLFCASQSENDEDMKLLKPIAEKLVYAVKLFKSNFDSIKRQADGMDFSDITHFALKLLIKHENGEPVKTKLAEEISEQFEEILVDEYQDINEIQNMLFTAVSKNGENLFTVGDVKQSIYRFRQAMPEIFLKKRNSLEDYTDGNYPAKITLDRNFRSRKGVTENINFVFSQLMREETGGVDYGESEALRAAANYPECDFAQTQLHILSGDDRVTRTDEAEYVAGLIKKAIDNKMQITDKHGTRDASYGDFCILLRSVSNGKAQAYAQALTDMNIPSYVSESTGFFSAAEVSTAVNLMRIIDNPIQDIPLLSVMFSPMFGFTADELAKMRIAERKAPIYHCVVNFAKNGDKKSQAFLDKLDKLRMMSSTLSCADFIREVYDETGYRAIVSAMKNGDARISNLNVLTDFAEKYESSGRRGLSGFIRFIDRIQKQDGDLESASAASDSADVVRIMTIHKSKGLEFPVCIVADLSAKFNRNIKPFSFHPDYGICFDIKDNRLKRRYTTVGKKAIDIAENNSSLSEELRILYVALTRAKEQLICVTRCDNPEKKLSELASGIEAGKELPAYLIKSRKSMAEWLWLSFLRHPDSVNMRVKAGVGEGIALPACERLEVIFDDKYIAETEESESKSEVICSDDSLSEIIRERISYKYPYGDLSGIAAKSAPSDFESGSFSTKYFASAKPRFLSKSGMTPANRGTATHKFMEFYDYGSDAGVEEQIKIMLSENRLTESEAKILDVPKLERFFKSELAERIKKSDTLLREEKVTIGIPAGELYAGLSEEAGRELVIIQGYVDCAFSEGGEFTIVDYKTDRVSSAEELKDKYSVQLHLYERALSECTGMKVRETLIYSFETGEYVKL